MSTFRMGINGSIATPGLAILPVNQAATRKADDLLNALSGVAGSAAAAGRMLRHQRLEEQQALEEHETLVRGNAALAAQTDWPGLLDEVNQGKVAAPDGEPIPTFAESLITQRTQGMSETGAREYRRQIQPRLVAALTEQVAGQRELANREILTNLSALAGQAQDPKDISAAIADATERFGNRMSESEIYSAVLMPGLKAAALAGDRQRFELLTGALGDRFPLEQEQAWRVFDGVDRERAKGIEDAAVDNFFAMERDGAPFDVLNAQLGKMVGTIPPDRLLSMKSRLLTHAQQRTEDALRTRIITGTITVPELDAEVKAAAKLGRDHPGFLDPATAQTLLDAAGRRDRIDLGKVQVGNVLAGGLGVLTEAQHGDAFMDLIGPEGVGVLDVGNRIAEPARLTEYLLRARIIPNDLSAAIVGSLTSTDAADVSGASIVVGAIGNASPRLYARLRDGQSESTRGMMDKAVAEWQRGRLQAPESRAAAVQAIIAARDVVQDVSDSLPAVVKDAGLVLKGDSDKGSDAISERADAALAAVRELFPHTKDAALGMDWLNPDPSMESPELNVKRRVSQWWAQRFGELRRTMGPAQAAAKADEYAQAQIKNSIDFVRWNGVVTPVLVDVGQGLRMPEHYRWSDGFETEAAADLGKHGFKVEEVVSLRPFANPLAKPSDDPTAALGWQFITREGEPLVDDNGRMVVYRPSDRSAESNAKLRRELDRREEDYRRRRAARFDAGTSPALAAQSLSQFVSREFKLPAIPDTSGMWPTSRR